LKETTAETYDYQ